jgi:threonine/homoserine/homoserine lactone efflux protein
MMPVFLRGFLIGLSIAAPVGPIGLICIQRTLQQGRMAGFISGMGAATADAIYGIISAFGLTFLSGFLVTQQFWLRLVGGLFLCYLGIRTFSRKIIEETPQINLNRHLGSYLEIFFLTLTNPLTILSFSLIFTGLGLGKNPEDYHGALNLVLGVFSGSAFWWLILSQGVGYFRKSITTTWQLHLNRVAGGVILLLGILAFVGLLIPELAG